MAFSRSLLASLLALSVGVTAIKACSEIAAFNIQILGRTKMGKPEVVDYLTKIIARYDLVLIQEIRDSLGSAIIQLLEQVNSQPETNFLMALGPRVGRSSSKEQYAYFYRPEKFELVNEFSYSEPYDEFEREPYIVHFRSVGSSSKVKEFTIIGLHSKPDDAVSEINALTEVYDYATQQTGVSDSVLMGDFNADCNYVRASKWPEISLWTDTRFKWLLPNEVDTTVKSTDCAYDRIVLAGSNMIANGNNPGVFDYQKEYSLTTELAADVSDHYPVFFTLY